MVANIKTMLEGGWVRSRKKDPGRGDACRKATERRGKGKEAVKARRKRNQKKWVHGEENKVITAPVTREGNGDESPRETRSGRTRATRKEVPEARSRSEEGPRRSSAEAKRKRSRSGGDTEETGDVDADLTRLEEAWEKDDEWTDQGEEDFEENLTFHEDSLSVMKGMISTPLGENVPMHITTDSGSMTQLMQRSFTEKLKLKKRAIPEGKGFHINSPGGGRDEVGEYVVIRLRVKCKRELVPEQGF
jgi:hypothetical protein